MDKTIVKGHISENQKYLIRPKCMKPNQCKRWLGNKDWIIFMLASFASIIPFLLFTLRAF